MSRACSASIDSTPNTTRVRAQSRVSDTEGDFFSSRVRMERTTYKVSSATPVDLDAARFTPIRIEHEVVTDRPTPPWIPTTAAVEDEARPRRDTPLLPAAFPSRGESRATLTVLTGMQAGRMVAIDATAGITVGRAADADLPVEDAGVSRQHLRVARTAEGTFYAEDLASTNGTNLNGTDVPPGSRNALAEGDVITLGRWTRLRLSRRG